MKKYLIILVFLVIANPCYGYARAANARTTFQNGYAWTGHPSKDLATQWAQAMEGLAETGGGIGTGSIWYVDSGVAASGSGTSWTDAVSNLDDVMALISADGGASRGDYVMVAEGHNEALTTANGVDCDVAGVTVIGKGRGIARPTFDYDLAAGEFVIGAANVTIKNLRFRASSSSITTGIDIETAGTGAAIIGCDIGFPENGAGTADEFIAGITINSGAGDALIAGNVFRMEAGTTSETAILVKQVASCNIENNFISGDYTVACISSAGVAKNMIIMNNVLFNGTMDGDTKINTVAAIAFRNIDASSGYIADNHIISDVTTALLMHVADDFVLMRNSVTDTDGDEFTGSLEGLQVGGSVVSFIDG